MRKFLLAVSTLSLLASYPSLASAQSKLALQNLPDGDYFFANRPMAVSPYIVLRKTGRTLTGAFLLSPQDNLFCFQGQANGERITNLMVSQAQAGTGAPVVAANTALSLNGLQRINSNQVPPNLGVQHWVGCVGRRYAVSDPSPQVLQPGLIGQALPGIRY